MPRLSEKSNLVVKESRTELNKIPVRIPKIYIKDIEQNLKDSGYNKKERTPWITDVINQFLVTSNRHEVVALEFIKPGTTKMLYFNMSDKLLKKIGELVEEVREKESKMKDRSSVIRSAIVHRLLSASGNLLEDDDCE